MHDKQGRRLHPRLELSGQNVDRTFAKYSRGTILISTKEWFHKLKLCWFEEEKLSVLHPDSFKLFEVLEMLEIQKGDIESYWRTIMKGIALIPSENFHKLKIITESSLDQSHLK